jgi:hypothetical protein
MSSREEKLLELLLQIKRDTEVIWNREKTYVSSPMGGSYAEAGDIVYTSSLQDGRVHLYRSTPTDPWDYICTVTEQEAREMRQLWIDQQLGQLSAESERG